ncbi:hypothetical protein CDV31_011253 [Fusarium ambrosium]|uniref:Uncharacterized protein n=1 Tax=Fusarium ambrosium TaxID=131363 RepID=A0A428THY8_9HYPO|nr:hypothetical protein CDV31_011253 [Fusarium ambrosium]
MKRQSGSDCTTPPIICHWRGAFDKDGLLWLWLWLQGTYGWQGEWKEKDEDAKERTRPAGVDILDHALFCKSWCCAHVVIVTK